MIQGMVWEMFSIEDDLYKKQHSWFGPLPVLWAVWAQRENLPLVYSRKDWGVFVCFMVWRRFNGCWGCLCTGREGVNRVKSIVNLNEVVWEDEKGRGYVGDLTDDGGGGGGVVERFAA